MVLGRKLIVGCSSSLIIGGPVITFSLVPLSLLLAVLSQSMLCQAQVFENILLDSHGSIQTRNNPFPHNDCDEVWVIRLKEHEHLVFNVDGNYTLNDDDTFSIKVDDRSVLFLENKTTPVEAERQMVLGPAEVRIVFNDHPPHCDGNLGTLTGLSGRYKITCIIWHGRSAKAPMDCVYETCQVNRNSSYDGPVSCSCPARYFQGVMCKEWVLENWKNVYGRGHWLSAASGKISTPNFPDAYPNGAFHTWNLQLEWFETVEFFRATESAPRFETCCDSFDVYQGGYHMFSFSAAGAGAWKRPARREALIQRVHLVGDCCHCLSTTQYHFLSARRILPDQPERTMPLTLE